MLSLFLHHLPPPSLLRRCGVTVHCLGKSLILSGPWEGESQGTLLWWIVISNSTGLEQHQLWACGGPSGRNLEALSMNENIQMDLIRLKRVQEGCCWPLLPACSPQPYQYTRSKPGQPQLRGLEEERGTTKELKKGCVVWRSSSWTAAICKLVIEYGKFDIGVYYHCYSNLHSPWISTLLSIFGML